MDPLIDAEQLARDISPEDLNASAEAYFSLVADPSYTFAKPLGAPVEAPGMLMHFAGMLHGLALEAKDVVLDFGAGACWTSRMLAQLDCNVIACDISPSALKLGEELFRLQPTLGFGSVRFLVFDGHRINLEDKSVDRIAVMDAFHHVPNWLDVLHEFYRVLKPGGLVVMAEPGPDHSRTPTAQQEMRNFTVLERDVDINDVARLAALAGFQATKIGMYSGLPTFVPVQQFDEELSTGRATTAATRSFLVNHRLIALEKGWSGVHSSAEGVDLSARMEINWRGDLTYQAVIRNSGAATWLPEVAERGTVRLGVQIFLPDGTVVTRDHQRVPLRWNQTRPVEPGQSVTIDFDVVAPPQDRYRIGFDMVSEHVVWFADAGNGPALVTGLIPGDGSVVPSGWAG